MAGGGGVNLLQSFSIPQISRVARHTAVSAVAIAVVALAVLCLFGYPFAGLGACVGVALALGNFRFTASAAAKAVRSQRESHRRPLAMNTLGRLGAVTVIAVALLLVDEQLGFGVLLGLALFQFILLTNMTVSLLKGAALTGLSGGFPDGQSDEAA